MPLTLQHKTEETKVALLTPAGENVLLVALHALFQAEERTTRLTKPETQLVTHAV